MRLFKVEVRRALRRRANRLIALVAIGIFILVAIVSSIQLDDLPPLQKITAADSPLKILHGELIIEVTIDDQSVHFANTFVANAKHKEFPGTETNTIDLAPGDKIYLEGSPGHQNVVVNYPTASLARFTDLYNHNSVENSTFNPAASILIFLALLAGATMIGADWKWNTYASFLTWEPRRIRFLAARFAAIFVVIFGAIIVLSAIFVLCTLPVVFMHGSFAGATASWWSFALEVLLRVAILGSLAGIGGACLAMIGRNTVAALIVSFVYLLILENLIIIWRPKLWYLAMGRVLPVLFAWKDTDLEGKLVGPGAAMTAAGVLILILIAAAAYSFSRRDVVAS